MRVFIAIEFNKGIKDYLYEIQQQAYSYCTRGNFTLRDNFHLTLRFLGEADERSVEAIKRAIDEAAKGQKPFNLKLSEIGTFKKGNRHVLWIGTSYSKELQEFYKAMEDSLHTKGIEREVRSYSPHITIGREVGIEDFNKLEQNVPIEPRDIFVNSISLMESTRMEGKLVYLPVYKIGMES